MRFTDRLKGLWSNVKSGAAKAGNWIGRNIVNLANMASGAASAYGGDWVGGLGRLASGATGLLKKTKEIGEALPDGKMKDAIVGKTDKLQTLVNTTEAKAKEKARLIKDTLKQYGPLGQNVLGIAGDMATMTL
jgi:hypothetical protein